MSSGPNLPSGLKLLRMLRTSSRYGVGAGALMIGIAFYLLLRGFGAGFGTGSGETEQPASADSANTPAAAAPADTTAATQPAETVAADKDAESGARSLSDLTADERRAISSGILTVLIDERKFLIQIADTPAPVFRSTILSRIPELVRRCSGDTNGIRVIVRRRETARPSAEADLRRELEKLQITSDAILMPEEILP